MSAYNIVPNAINNLSNRVMGMSQNRERHQERMGGLGLAGARMSAEQAAMKGSQDFAIAEQERENFLDEPISLSSFIESSEIPDENKLQILNSLPGDIASIPTTRRKALGVFEQIRKESGEKENLTASRNFQQGLQTERLESQDKRSRLDRESRERIYSGRIQGKGPSVASQKYNTDIAVQNLMGKYGIKEALNGGMQGPKLTAEQAEGMKAEAANLGVNVYFDQGVAEDTGSGWNPFDNKEYPVYSVRALVPSGNAPMKSTGHPQQAAQPSPSVVPGAQTGASPAAQVIGRYLNAPEPQAKQSTMGLAGPKQQVASLEEKSGIWRRKAERNKTAFIR